MINETKAMSGSKKENKRNLILDTAFALFMKNGYAKIKIIDITTKAGVGKGTFYEYFKSKDDMLIELINRYVKGEFLKLYNRLKEFTTFEEKLTAIITFEFDFLKRYGPHAFEIKQRIFDTSAFDFSEELVKAISEIISLEYENILETVTFGIETGVVKDFDVHTAAHFILGTMASFAPFASDLHGCVPFLAELSELSCRTYTPSDVYNIIMNGIGADSK